MIMDKIMDQHSFTYDSLQTSFPALFSNDNSPFFIILNAKEIDEWKRSHSDSSNFGIVFEDPFIIILKDLVQFPNGRQNGYIRLYNRAYLEGGAAGVVMLPRMHEKFLLIHNYRHATRKWHWEIPRGFGEPGVIAKKQAEVEIDEEIGGEIKQIFDLGVYFCNTGVDGNPISLFLVEMKSIGSPKIELGVDKFRWVSVQEIEQMIANEEITDGFTIASYTRAKYKGYI
jgi:ADP-ribose pyrophosphatase